MGAAVFCGLSLFCFVTGPVLARFGIVSPMAALGFLALAAGLGIVSTELGLVAVIQRRAEWLHYLGFAGLLPAGFVVAAMVRGLLLYPSINDITTDLEEPPVFTHAQTLPENEGRDMAFPAASKAIIRESYPEVQPLHVEESPEAAYATALEVARQQKNWTITHESPETLTFEGVAVTPILRFHDDVIVRVRPCEDGVGAVIDMRSKSRQGKGDLGRNAERIHAFFEQLEQTLPTIQKQSDNAAAVVDAGNP